MIDDIATSAVDDTALPSSTDFSQEAASTDIAPEPISDGAGLERQSRVQHLIRQKHAADSFAARTAADAAALRGQGQRTGRPQDYAAPEEYTRAVAEQAVREVGADILARQAADAQDIAVKAAKEAWQEATADLRQRVPDFDAVVHNPNLTVTPVMADAIHESSRGPEIAYYLGKNPAEAAHIANLPPVSQATAIARLEGRLGSTTVSVSRAPKPVGTLSGSGGSSSPALEDLDFEDYRRARGF
jgi:hypothetical protein